MNLLFRALMKMISLNPIFVPTIVAVCLGGLLIDLKPSFGLQLDEVVPFKDAAVGPQPEKKAGGAANTPPQGVIDTNDVPMKEKIGDQFAQLHLRDGSIIGGNIKTPSIDVKTKYGVLKVPISRISSIVPGLNGNPKLKGKIERLVKGLGADKVATRDASQRDLIAMGLKIKNVLKTCDDGKVAERTKRLVEIRAEFDEIEAEMQEEFISPEAPLELDDIVATPDFSIVGEIQQKEFDVSSKFGRLQVQLGDIVLADRMINRGRPEIRKKVTVDAMAFFQKQPQPVGVRVNKGDRISIQASGVVQWTNWNNSSTPDGLTNRSSWQGINSGKLVARIGTDNSNCVEVGAKGDFVAKKSGALYLGISMRDSYARSTSYTWTGNYKAKVRISPGSKGSK